MRQLIRDLTLFAAGTDSQFAKIGLYATGLDLPSAELFVDRCSDCCSRRNMSSIPQSALAAAKVHRMMAGGDPWVSNTFMERNVKTSEKASQSTSWFPWMNQYMDHPLAKYNSKMMNSIWGLYNRYSVHNFKRVTEEELKGKAGEWVSASSLTMNQKLHGNQPNQSVSSASGVGIPASTFPNASAPVRDANPLNSFWIGNHHH